MVIIEWETEGTRRIEITNWGNKYCFQIFASKIMSPECKKLHSPCFVLNPENRNILRIEKNKFVLEDLDR